MSKFIPITIVTVIIIAICLYFILIHNKTGFKKIEKFEKSKLLKENYKTGENIHFRENNIVKIPKQLYLTHHSKNKIPKKVYDNLDKYARINGNKINYKIYDDDEIIDFLSKYYNDVVVDKFKKLNFFQINSIVFDILEKLEKKKFITFIFLSFDPKPQFKD